MTIKFIDAAEHHRGLEHQNRAWEFLQASVSKEVLHEFARIYRSQKVESIIEDIPQSGVSLIKEFEDFSSTYNSDQYEYTIKNGGNSRETAGDKPEEGGDDVKSSWPLRPGLHTCYNGAYRGLQASDSERIPKSAS